MRIEAFHDALVILSISCVVAMLVCIYAGPLIGIFVC